MKKRDQHITIIAGRVICRLFDVYKSMRRRCERCGLVASMAWNIFATDATFTQRAQRLFR